MLHIILILTGLIFSSNKTIQSQELPQNRRIDWAKGLALSQFTYPERIIDFIAAGGNNGGFVPNDQIMSTILNEIHPDTGAIIYFPEGEYLFNETIGLKSNVVLKGVSATATHLNFDLGGSGNLIEIKGLQTIIESEFTIGTAKGDSSISLAHAGLFQIGDYIRIIDYDSLKVTSDWAVGSTGQIAQVKGISENKLILANSLRRGYLISNEPKVIHIEPIKNVGIEQLTINRIDTTSGQTSHIYMHTAANCWVNCIKSYNSNFSHVTILYSTNCNVEGSYFQDAFAYGGGGQGYGVVIGFVSGECLVYNNIFKHLRHSILLHAGANGNVISYNYSREPYWTDVSLPSNSAGDLVLHGNYPYCNLFEGNITQNIVIDNSHGANGPFNTFHRNRGELYGIFMNSGAGDSLNFISNEVTNTGFILGLYFITGIGHFQYGNIVKGNITPSGTNGTTLSSLYLSSPLPYYESNSFWPPIGVIENYNTYLNESTQRYNNNILTQCSEWNVLNINESAANEEVILFPNPVFDYLTLKGMTKASLVQIIDLKGRIIANYSAYNEVYTIDLENLNPGMYLCLIRTGNSTQAIKFIKSE